MFVFLFLELNTRSCLWYRVGTSLSVCRTKPFQGLPRAGIEPLGVDCSTTVES